MTTPDIVRFVKSSTGKLAATYLAIIMLLTVVFSVILFAVTTHNLTRPHPEFDITMRPGMVRDELEDILARRTALARADAVMSVILFDLSVLFVGAIASYYLARWTLEPIERVMQQQEQFVCDASHELRTPLTALQTTNEVALRKKKLTLAEAKDIIAHNVDETHKLRDLSNQLLGAVTHQASLKKTDVDISMMMSDVMASVVPLAQQKRIKVEDQTVPVVVRVNQPALEQVLRILIDNAIKYSPPKSTVRVGTRVLVSSVAIDVTDEGIGISKADQAKIFDRFYRVDQSRNKTHVDGTGLGLAIAKSVCEQHDMRLDVASESRKGSTFSVYVSK